MTVPDPPPRQPRWRGLLNDIATPWNTGGVILGGLVALWASSTSRVRGDEAGVLLAIAAGGTAILAVVLAAIALMAGFLRGFFGAVIAEKGIPAFFRPFEVVSIVSALAALFGFVGGINGSSGTQAWRDALFGLAAWFMTAAIVGTVGLVYVFVRYARRQWELEGEYPD